jgi:Tol biopolymer transport system component
MIGVGVFRGLYVFDLETLTFFHVRDFNDLQTSSQFRWGYDDEFIYYRALYGGMTNLYAVELDTNISTPLSEYKHGYFYGDMAVSPDTEKIAYKIGTHDVDMEEGLIIENYENITIAEIIGHIDNPTWSPDSNKLVYAKDGNIYLFDILALEEQFLASGENNTILQIVWSPDGSLVICKGDTDTFFYDMQMHKEVSTPIVNEEYFELSIRP